jgi:hypothetical protein
LRDLNNVVWKNSSFSQQMFGLVDTKFRILNTRFRKRARSSLEELLRAGVFVERFGQVGEDLPHEVRDA